MRYDRITRWLHAGIALSVSAQLGLSLFMDAPDDTDEVLASGLPLRLFEIHEKIGMTLLALIILHWLWSLSGHVQNGLGHLFPWFSKGRLDKVIDEAQATLKLKLPDPEISNALAGAVHGLGLLAATGMAITGAVIFFNLSKTGHMTELGKLSHGIHGLIAPLCGPISSVTLRLR
ncbi:MAG: cytochrome b/b6 domain-containing protein [Nitrosomonadales bacterium]